MRGAISNWLRTLPRPLALFACNDIRAQQVLNACREQAIKVPEEVAVMGVDNDDVLCNLCEPPLTSIEPDMERIGYEAAALLDRMIKGQSGGAGIAQIPPARIVERASTDVVPDIPRATPLMFNAGFKKSGPAMLRRITTSACLSALLLDAGCAIWKHSTVTAAPDECRPAAILATMERVTDWQLAHPASYRTTDWTQGALYAGIMALDSISPGSRFRESMRRIGEEN